MEGPVALRSSAVAWHDSEANAAASSQKLAQDIKGRTCVRHPRPMRNVYSGSNQTQRPRTHMYYHNHATIPEECKHDMQAIG